MRELVAALQSELHCDPKGLDRHDRHGADRRTNRNVNQRVLSTVYRRNSIYHDRREYGNREAVCKKSWKGVQFPLLSSPRLQGLLTWLDCILQNLVDSLHVFIRRGMQDNHHGTQEASSTAQLPQRTQPLMQEDGPENSTAQDQYQCLTLFSKARQAYPIKTLSAPNGVTRIAGAKAYAAKFATSPIPTAKTMRGQPLLLLLFLSN